MGKNKKSSYKRQYQAGTAEVGDSSAGNQDSPSKRTVKQQAKKNQVESLEIQFSQDLELNEAPTNFAPASTKAKPKQGGSNEQISSKTERKRDKDSRRKYSLIVGGDSGDSDSDHSDPSQDVGEDVLQTPAGQIMYSAYQSLFKKKPGLSSQLLGKQPDAEVEQRDEASAISASHSEDEEERVRGQQFINSHVTGQQKAEPKGLDQVPFQLYMPKLSFPEFLVAKGLSIEEMINEDAGADVEKKTTNTWLLKRLIQEWQQHSTSDLAATRVELKGASFATLKDLKGKLDEALLPCVERQGSQLQFADDELMKIGAYANAVMELEGRIQAGEEQAERIAERHLQELDEQIRYLKTTRQKKELKKVVRKWKTQWSEIGDNASPLVWAAKHLTNQGEGKKQTKPRKQGAVTFKQVMAFQTAKIEEKLEMHTQVAGSRTNGAGTMGLIYYEKQDGSSLDFVLRDDKRETLTSLELCLRDPCQLRTLVGKREDPDLFSATVYVFYIACLAKKLGPGKGVQRQTYTSLATEIGGWLRERRAKLSDITNAREQDEAMWRQRQELKLESTAADADREMHSLASQIAERKYRPLMLCPFQWKHHEQSLEIQEYIAKTKQGNALFGGAPALDVDRKNVPNLQKYYPRRRRGLKQKKQQSVQEKCDQRYLPSLQLTITKDQEYARPGVTRLFDAWKKRTVEEDQQKTLEKGTFPAWSSEENLDKLDNFMLSTYVTEGGYGDQFIDNKRVSDAERKNPVWKNLDVESKFLFDRAIDNYKNLPETALELVIGYTRQLFGDLLKVFRSAGETTLWQKLIEHREQQIGLELPDDALADKEAMKDYLTHKPTVDVSLDPGDSFRSKVTGDKHSQAFSAKVARRLGTNLASPALYYLAAHKSDEVGTWWNIDPFKATLGAATLKLHSKRVAAYMRFYSVLRNPTLVINVLHSQLEACQNTKFHDDIEGLLQEEARTLCVMLGKKSQKHPSGGGQKDDVPMLIGDKLEAQIKDLTGALDGIQAYLGQEQHLNQDSLCGQVYGHWYAVARALKVDDKQIKALVERCKASREESKHFEAIQIDNSAKQLLENQNKCRRKFEKLKRNVSCPFQPSKDPLVTDLILHSQELKIYYVWPKRFTTPKKIRQVELEYNKLTPVNTAYQGLKVRFSEHTLRAVTALAKLVTEGKFAALKQMKAITPTEAFHALYLLQGCRDDVVEFTKDSHFRHLLKVLFGYEVESRFKHPNFCTAARFKEICTEMYEGEAKIRRANQLLSPMEAKDGGPYVGFERRLLESTPYYCYRQGVDDAVTKRITAAWAEAQSIPALASCSQFYTSVCHVMPGIPSVQGIAIGAGLYVQNKDTKDFVDVFGLLETKTQLSRNLTVALTNAVWQGVSPLSTNNSGQGAQFLNQQPPWSKNNRREQTPAKRGALRPAEQGMIEAVQMEHVYQSQPVVSNKTPAQWLQEKIRDAIIEEKAYGRSLYRCLAVREWKKHAGTGQPRYMGCATDPSLMNAIAYAQRVASLCGTPLGASILEEAQQNLEQIPNEQRDRVVQQRLVKSINNWAGIDIDKLASTQKNFAQKQEWTKNYGARILALLTVGHSGKDNEKKAKNAFVADFLDTFSPAKNPKRHWTFVPNGPKSVTGNAIIGSHALAVRDGDRYQVGVHYFVTNKAFTTTQPGSGFQWVGLDAAVSEPTFKFRVNRGENVPGTQRNNGELKPPGAEPEENWI